jgi:PAS domain S-box-containing protein
MEYKSNHRPGLSQAAVQIASVMAATIIMTGALVTVKPAVFDFTWRWYAFGVILAIIATVTMIVLMLMRSPHRKGPFYWFIALNITNLLLLFITLAQVLSVTPQAAAFWQGLLPMGWIPIPVLLVFFATSYVEDSDLPRNVGLWGISLVSVLFMLFFAGLTNLIESHVPHNMAFNVWGWQSEPGKLLWVTYVWAMVLTLAALFTLVRARQEATDQRTKRQITIFIMGLAQYMAIALLFDFGLGLLFPYAAPPLSFLYFTTLSIIIGYGIIRYGLFQITPTSLASSILENLSEAVLGINPDRRIEFANQGAQVLFGQRRPDLKGALLSTLFKDRDLEIMFEGMENSLGLFSMDEVNITTHSGQTVPVVVNLSWALNEQGVRVGYIMAIQNVTELKKKTAQLAKEKASVERKVALRTRELHDERAKLRASIDSLTLGFLLVDSQNKIVMQNRALQSVLSLKGPADSLASLDAIMGRYDLAAHCQTALQRRKPSRAQELTIGSKVVKVFLGPVSSSDEPDAALLGTVVLMEDITEAKVLERSRDEFFSIASHELRTPLTAIRGNASMMTQYYSKVLNEPNLQEMVDDIEASSTRLIAIVNDFLDMSRLEQGKITFKYEAFAMEPLIERLAYEMKPVLQEKSLRFEFDVQALDSLPQVWADRSRVQQVLYNLIGNAVKFTNSGSVSLSTGLTDNKHLKVTVTDTGRGIPVASRKLLFRKFQQAGNSILTRDTTRGTGLGLYISKLMLERMGGTITLESSKEGKGSVFSFTVPLATGQQKKP